MNLMLTVIFLWVAVGLLSPSFGGRQHLAVVLLATALTAAFLLSFYFSTGSAPH
jgi:hypothetical protein